MKNPSIYLELPDIQPAETLPHGSCVDCKTILNIGIFFDGTDNNRERDMKNSGHSNIARLYDVYKEIPDEGYFRYYVPGVGTSFKEIGELDAPFAGSPWGRGGEARIVYSLLQVLNSINFFVTKSPLFDNIQMAALASEGAVAEPTPDQFPYQYSNRDLTLKKLGLSGGLVGNWGVRKEFLLKKCAKLLVCLENTKRSPSISGIYLDIFGFSRGATQARVFSNWLYESMLWDGKLCGVKSYVRILGLFDTVASIGLSKSGHHSWAISENLKIRSEIKTCIHYVALHEFRNNFPVDSIMPHEETLSSNNLFEQIAIGCHSDVGGGYEPGEQGKGVLDELDDFISVNPSAALPGTQLADKEKLSQLALNLMLNSARKSCETHGADGNPWIEFNSKEGDRRKLHQQFEYSKKLLEFSEKYFSSCGIEQSMPLEQVIREHITLYLAWRYQISLGEKEASFQNLPSVKRGKIVDPNRVKYYLLGQDIFIEQITQLKRMTSSLNLISNKEEDYEKIGYHRKAGEIFQNAKKIKVPAQIGVFFDKYVHDSYAGFIGKFGDGAINGFTHRIAEHKLYFTYRGMYVGSDDNLNAKRNNQEGEPILV